MKRPLSRTQIVCIVLLWAALCYIVLVNAEQINGPIILTLLLSGAFVFVPVYQSVRKNREKR